MCRGADVITTDSARHAWGTVSSPASSGNVADVKPQFDMRAASTRLTRSFIHGFPFHLSGLSTGVAESYIGLIDLLETNKPAHGFHVNIVLDVNTLDPLFPLWDQ